MANHLLAHEPVYPLQAHERRITLRLLAYWEKIRGSKPMPREQDIDPDDIQDLWDNCLLIHTKDLGQADYNFTYIGSKIIEAYTGNIAESDHSQLVSVNAGKLAACYRQVVESRKPLTDEGEFINLHGDLIKYRQCLLPLGEGDTVSAIFGGMRYKVFSR